MRETDEWFNKQQEPVKSCLLALREVVLRHNEHMTEHWKYRMPCYCYKNKMFCYLRIDKATQWPYVLIVEGKDVTHALLEEGNRSRMKRLMINPEKDIPIKVIRSIFKTLISRYR
jgi:hypothetical protein